MNKIITKKLSNFESRLYGSIIILLISYCSHLLIKESSGIKLKLDYIRLFKTYKFSLLDLKDAIDSRKSNGFNFKRVIDFRRPSLLLKNL